MGARLLDGENAKADEYALDLPRSALAELKYNNLTEVIDDFKKLTGEYPLKAELPELDDYHPNKIQCSYSRVCAFTRRLENTLAVSVVRRLGEISQLGLIVLIYPTATHTRLEHSLGVYATAVSYCNALWNDPINPLFKQLMTPAHLRTLLCAALCHDIGQYGLAHDFEEAKKSVFDHTRLTIKVLTDGVVYKSLHDVLKNEWKVDPQKVANILATNPNNLDQPITDRLLHTVIDSPIDADKGDYLVRDSRKLGLSYGEGIDLERLVSCLTVTFRKEDDNRIFISAGVTEKGKIAAEAFGFARYALFGSVYWHHTSRAMKSMLHYAIWEILPSESDISAHMEFSRKFEDFVLNKLQEKKEEQQDFDFMTPPKLPYAAQLSQGDQQILKWLHRITTDAGKDLISLMLSRQVFKRLMVVSHAKEPDLWLELKNIRNLFINFKDFLDFQKIFQRMLIQEITSINLDEILDQIPMASVLKKSEIEEIKAMQGLKKVLVTIDIPFARPGTTVPLQYLSEERVKGKRLIGKVASLEDSIVWQAISTRFVESVGKARIFVHPKYAKYFEILIPHENLVRKLRAAEEELKIEIARRNK